ncbi:YesL family protein [Oceanobacillus sp. 1P07AA]|uniref:YesL family protein n=1 Tax=Oceanobacillus sp. 1P07AA TaxID=3132293 RepID=UPI0039A6C954
MNLFASRLYTIMEWVMKFAYLHLLWVIFTLLGLVIVGFYPATLSTYSIVRKWLTSNPDIPILSTFWTTYKDYFKKGNILGIGTNLFIALAVINIIFIQSYQGAFSMVQVPLMAFLLLVCLFFIYLFPVAVHFDLPVTKIIKQSFLIMLISPIHTLLIMVSFVSIYLICTQIPALFFIFGISIIASISTWIIQHRFDTIQSFKKS